MRNKSIYIFIVLLCVTIQIHSENTVEPATFLIGNDNLLAGVTKKGTITFARWRGIGGNNHFDYNLKSLQNSGQKPFIEPTTFFIHKQDSIYSLTETIKGNYIKPEIPLISLVGTNNKLQWEEEIFVHPTKDIILLHFNFNTPQPENFNGNLIAYQNITPKPATIQENPFLDTTIPQQTDFCVFWDRTLQALIYFRPNNAGKADLFRLQQIKEPSELSPKFWRKFEDGVYIGIFSLNPIKGANILNFPPSSNHISHLTNQTFPSTFYALDNFHTSLVIQPEHTGELTLLYVFAENYQKLEETIQQIKTQNYPQLKEECIHYWQKRWDITKESINEKYVNQWLNIILCSDTSTGAILTRPFDPIYGNRISLQDSFFQIQSLTSIKMIESAKNLLLFWAKIARERIPTTKQTFPLYVYTNRKPACPDYWADIKQSSYFVLAVNTVVENMNLNEKKEFLNEIWDAISWSVDSLCFWRAPGELIPAPSFTEQVNHDAQTANLLIQALIGIQQGIKIGKIISKPIPEHWETRDKELQTAIRLSILNNTALKVFPEKELPLWEKFFPSNHPIWNLPVKHQQTITPLKNIKQYNNESLY